MHAVEKKGFLVAAKGAPEIMKTLMTSVPDNYDKVAAMHHCIIIVSQYVAVQIAKHHTCQGGRVLAIGYRVLPAEVRAVCFLHAFFAVLTATRASCTTCRATTWRRT